MSSKRKTPGTWSIFLLFASATFLVSACTSGVQASLAKLPGTQSAIPISTGAKSAIPTSTVWTPGPDWALSWSDNFSRPDALQDWTPEVGGFSEESQELQYYSPKNAWLQPGGGLEIVATTNGYGQQCWYGTCRYSSAMLKTAGHFQQQYGIFSAYIKLPAGRGLWPAFWMTGADGGEIDIIEVNNQYPNLVEGFVHSPQVTRGLYLHLKTSLYGTYHEFSVEWIPTGITWLIDGHAYGHVHTTPGSSPFNQSFSLLLDLAVGGTWPGPPTASTVFPAQLNVAWVRVYKYRTNS